MHYAVAAAEAAAAAAAVAAAEAAEAARPSWEAAAGSARLTCAPWLLG